MPPVTPSAMSIGQSGESLNRQIRLLVLDLLDAPRHHFFGGDGGLLAIVHLDARRGSGEELPRTRAGGDDELERILKLAAIDHGCSNSTRRSEPVPASSRAPPSRR